MTLKDLDFLDGPSLHISVIRINFNRFEYLSPVSAQFMLIPGNN